MLNSLTLRQQHFLYQRKNLYNQEPSRSSSGETVPEDDSKTSWLEFFILFLGSPYFIWGSVVETERVVRIGISRKSKSGYKHIGYRNICKSS